MAQDNQQAPSNHDSHRCATPMDKALTNLMCMRLPQGSGMQEQYPAKINNGAPRQA